MLQVHDLTCMRGDRVLFSGASFDLSPGDLLRVSGHNGAGKTSLLRLLCGLATPEKGEVLWNKENIQVMREEFSRHLLYLGHAAALKDELTAVENLMVSSTIAGREISASDAHVALAAMGLGGREHVPAQSLSAGQRRRTNFSQLMLPNAPSLWILDEPFNALDAKAVDQLRGLLERHVLGGGIVAFTTHQEVEFLNVSPRQLVVERGRVALC